MCKPALAGIYYLGERSGWNGVDWNPGQGAGLSEMGWNILKDELGAGQRQTCFVSARIHLSSFWEVVSKRDSLAVLKLFFSAVSHCPAFGELLALCFNGTRALGAIVFQRVQ